MDSEIKKYSDIDIQLLSAKKSLSDKMKNK